MNHESIEKNVGLMGVLIAHRDQLRRPRRDRAAVLPGRGHAAGPGHQAVRGAETRRPRRLRPRRLLRLPLADDPAVPLGNGALRAVLAAGRIRVRPPVPVRLEAHRARPGARRRPLLGRLAARAPAEPAQRRAGVQHAALPVAGGGQGRRRAGRDEDARAAHGRRAVHGRRHRGRRRRPCRTRPSSTRWSPTCRVSASTRSRAADPWASARFAGSSRCS